MDEIFTVDSSESAIIHTFLYSGTRCKMANISSLSSQQLRAKAGLGKQHCCAVYRGDCVVGAEQFSGGPVRSVGGWENRILIIINKPRPRVITFVDFCIFYVD